MASEQCFWYFKKHDAEIVMRRQPFLLVFGIGILLAGCLSLVAGDAKEAVRITIIFTDSSGAAVPHAQIKLAPQTATTPKNPETNEMGSIALNVIPGQYDLFVTSPEFAPWAKNIRLEANPNQTVRVVLQVANTTQLVQVCSGGCPPIQIGGLSAPPIPHSASITVTVTDAAGAPIPYAQIGVDPRENAWEVHEADESGKFSLKVDPGIYDVAVTRPGFQRWTKHIKLEEKENQAINVILQIGGCLPGPCSAVESTH
jgi:hypothetical protein